MNYRKICTALITLMLIASANACPLLSLVDEYQTINTTPGSIVRLEFDTNKTIVTMDALITVDGDAIITGAINTSDCAVYGWDPGLSLDPLGLGINTVQIDLGNSMGNPGPIVGYVEVTYGGGTVTVSGLVPPNPKGTRFSDGYVTIVPEPATFLLLALGALTLRRKYRP